MYKWFESYDKVQFKLVWSWKLEGYRLREFRKDLGMIFQGFNLLKENCVENVLPLEVWGYEEEYKSIKKNAKAKSAQAIRNIKRKE